MRLNTDARLPQENSAQFYQLMKLRISEIVREFANQVNGVSEGRIVSNHTASTAAPTVGDYVVGDFVKNSAPAELGSAGSKYVIHGWQCVTAGSPGTWVQCRFLTGN